MVQSSTSKRQQRRLKFDIYKEREKLETLSVKADAEGLFKFPSQSQTDPFRHFSFEGRNGNWTIVSEVPFWCNNQSNTLGRVKISAADNQYILQSEGKSAVVFARWYSDEDTQFTRVQFLRKGTISVGRDFQNDIQAVSAQASRQHAQITYDGNKFYIRDMRSTNGTYVNGWRVEEKELECGDFLYLGGVELIVGIGFLMVNQGSREIPDALIKSSLLQVWKPESTPSSDHHKNIDHAEVFINRYPRSRTSLKNREIRIEAPPYSMDSKQMPLMLRMGSSLVMGGSAALMGNFTMLITSVLFPFLSSKYTEKEKQEYEQKRVSKYTAYLKNKEQEIQYEIQHEWNVLNRNYPSFDEILSYADRVDKIWTHKENDDDFLQLRIGTGDVAMKAKLEVPSESFALEEDFLLTRMFQLGSQKYMIPNAPILIDLLNNNIVSITGDQDGKWNLLILLLTRISLLFSYDEVKLVFVLNEETLEKYPYIRYLPHCFNDDFTERTVATDTGQTLQISKKLNDIFAERLNNEVWKEQNDHKEHYVIISDSKRNLDQIEILKKAMSSGKNLGFTVLTVFDELLKDTKIQIDFQNSLQATIHYLEDLDRSDEAFQIDAYNPRAVERSIRSIFQFRLNDVNQRFSLPTSLDFLSMFDTTDIHYLNPLNRWKESNPVRSLAAPIGINADGTMFTLDLHQNYQGPHGLVAGTTGSGKSEFLISYILSMAVNYSPYEVTFVLIDYKGGGLAGAFSNPEKGISLPHLVGTMTNLDGATISRSIMSIESELKRRQMIFNEAKKKLDEGTMDIYLYQKLFREGKVDKPVSHLFIISDEFAELKQQEPEFMDKLISTARIGRSLGVHLILATQKPSGVVNDQILSNVKFKVCLKVQDASDSNDMLKRPDAASLKEAGRFYLQVGYNEYFALGQSAWTGALYQPGVKKEPAGKNTVEFIDNTGTIVHTGKKQASKKTEGSSQLVTLVKELAMIAQANHIETEPLWLPSLPKVLDADECSKKVDSDADRKAMRLYLGFADDPGHQKQHDYIVSLLEMKNLFITGDMGSGRSSLVQTILLKACEQFSPEQLNIYAIDFSGKGFNRLRTLPHAGTILSESDVDDYPKFFDLINDIVQERKDTFEQAGVDDYNGYCEIHPMPLVLIALDDFPEIKNSKAGERIAIDFHEYLRKSSRYGLCYIVTAGQASDLMTRAKNEFFELIALQHQDQYKYSDTLNIRVQGTIASTPGRGYCVINEEAFECQFVRIRNDLRGFERNRYLKELVEKICQKYPGKYQIAKIPKIPQDETYADFASQFPKDRLPLGYHLIDSKPIAIPYKQFSMMTLYFGGDIATDAIRTNFLDSLYEQDGEMYLLSREGSSFLTDYAQKKGSSHLHVSDTEAKTLETLWNELLPELNRRIDLHIDYCSKMGMERFDPESDRSFSYMREATKPVILFFEDYGEFCEKAEQPTVDVFETIYQRAKWWNVYIFACLYPDKANKVAFSRPYKIFNKDKLVMLFGGDFKKQSLIGVTKEGSEIKKDEPPNLCYMEYQGQEHFLYIPCGVVKKAIVDEVDLPIFG